MKYAFIDAHRVHYPVPMMCELFEVSRSGYHAWRGRGPSPRQLENTRMVAQIRVIHAASDGSYGSPRVYEELRAQGNVVSLNRVRRLMKKNGIAARHKRKFRATTDSRHGLPVAPNRLEQNFVAERLDQVWLTDVTYLWTDEGWLYLACVLDLYSRRIVGWAMSERNDRHLAIAALGMAYFQRRPPRGLVHHSDRGSVYCSHDYQKLVQQYGMVCSMSRKGDCYDNAPMESWFKTLKVERVNLQRYATRAQARSDVFSYIEAFYNPRRRHSSLGYVSPREFERRLAAKEAA
jgi:putative transposase